MLCFAPCHYPVAVLPHLAAALLQVIGPLVSDMGDESKAKELAA